MSTTKYSTPICSCVKCKREFTRNSSLVSHACYSATNYSDIGKKGRDAQILLIYNKQKEKWKQYYANPATCSICLGPKTWFTKRNKFCSQTCGAIASNNTRSPESRNKQKETLRSTLLAKGYTFKEKNNNYNLENSSSQLVKTIKSYPCKACGENHQSAINKNNCACGLSTKLQSFNGLSKYFDLNLNNLGTPQFISDVAACKEYIEDLYKQHSLPSLAVLVSHPDKSGGNLGKILKSLGIRLDTNSEAQRKALIQGRATINHYISQTYSTGYFTYLNKEYFYRSSYELKFAEYLIYKNVMFDMESIRIKYYDTIEHLFRVAVPDFIIGNIIVEVKSNYTYDNQNMCDKFKAYSELGYTPYLLLEHTFMVPTYDNGPTHLNYENYRLPFNYKDDVPFILLPY